MQEIVLTQRKISDHYEQRLIHHKQEKLKEANVEERKLREIEIEQSELQKWEKELRLLEEEYQAL